MSREEIKEYLKRVEELEVKLVDEDQETLQWLIFGYNQCARLLNETERENQQLKQIEQEHQKINGELRKENKELKRNIETYKKFAKINVDLVISLTSAIDEIKKEINRYINECEIEANGTVNDTKCKIAILKFKSLLKIIEKVEK